jgi:hypothetical protein
MYMYMYAYVYMSACLRVKAGNGTAPTLAGKVLCDLLHSSGVQPGGRVRLMLSMVAWAT